MTLNQKNGKDVTNYQHDVIVIFWRCFVSRVRFTYWSKFHVDIATDSGVMINLLLQEIDQKYRNRKYPIWVLPNIWKLEQVRNTKFGMQVSNRLWLNAAKSQGYSFYHLCVVTGKTIGWGQIRIKLFYLSLEVLISFYISYSFITLFTETNSLWVIFKLNKALEIKTSRLFNVFDTILSCFFIFFLIIDLFFLIPAVTASIF